MPISENPAHGLYYPFGAEDFLRFDLADRDFTRFNTERSLREAEGEFVTRDFGAGICGMRDLTREASYYNRVIGLSDAGLERLEEVIAWYHEAGRDCHLTLTPERATPEVMEALAGRGFALVSQDWFFAQACIMAEPPKAKIAIRRAGEEDLDTVFDLWETPDDPIVQVVRDLRRAAHLHPDFALYIADLDGRPAAMASSFISNGIAWMGNANTLPELRCRGAQQALMAQRMWDARQAGCLWALTDCEFGSTTHRNAERMGMRMAFATLELRLPVP